MLNKQTASVLILFLVGMVWSWPGYAGEPFSLPLSSSTDLLIVDHSHRVGIKKVGYQIRQSGPMPVPLPFTSITLSHEAPPALSSPFWTSPIVLSLQRKAHELPC